MVFLLLAACGSLEKRAVTVEAGDTKQSVLAALGAPGDRQFSGEREAWQYCQTGAGFGYHDYRVVWFRAGKVVSVTSYKDRTPASGCSAAFKPINWDDTPN